MIAKTIYHTVMLERDHPQNKEGKNEIVGT